LKKCSFLRGASKLRTETKTEGRDQRRRGGGTEKELTSLHRHPGGHSDLKSREKIQIGGAQGKKK